MLGDRGVYVRTKYKQRHISDGGEAEGKSGVLLRILCRCDTAGRARMDS